jgi:mRNA-degrading endonuclease toxin of MazEF toxin-antitoxin module
LALALIGRISGTGSWCGLVGVGDVGALAMVGYGVDLDRLAVIHAPPVPWTQVVGMLLDGMDVVVANSSGRPRPAAARQLVARARHRHAVLVVVGTSPAWPAPADVHLRVTDGRWQGLGRGFGSLQARRVSVVVQGHGSGARPVERELWLPDAAGRVAPA